MGPNFSKCPAECFHPLAAGGNRPQGRLLRLRPPAHLGQHVGQVIPGDAEIRLNLCGRRKRLAGPFRVAGRIPGIAQGQSQVYMIRPALDSGLITFQGAGQVAGLLQSQRGLDVIVRPGRDRNAARRQVVGRGPIRPLVIPRGWR